MDGSGAAVSVIDSSFLQGVARQYASLSGLAGDKRISRHRTRGPSPGTAPRGRGCTVHGAAADVRVEGFLTHGGAICESGIVTQLDDALDRVPDLIGMWAGAKTRRSLNLLALEVFSAARMRHYTGTVLVAAAGNDKSRGPFWSAALP